MNFKDDVKVVLGVVLLASAGCYAGVPSATEDTDGAGSGDTDGATDGGPGSGPGGEGGESGESGGESGDGGPGGDPLDPPEPPDGCLAGSIGCDCLPSGDCMGLSACIDEVCTPAPPVPDVGGPTAAIAGVAVRLDGAINVPNELDGVNVFETLLWEQVSGPQAELEYEFSTEAIAWLPPDAPNDAELTFRLTAELGGVVESGEYTMSVLPAEPGEVMGDMMDVAAFGGAQIGRALDDVWLATSLGLVARVGDEGIVSEEDMMGRVTQIRGYGNNMVLFLQPDNGRVMQFNGNNNVFSEFITQLTSGDPLGPVVSVAGFNGDLYFGTEDGRIVLYDDPDDAEPAVTLDRYTIAQIPTVMTVGQHPVSPDVDEDDEGVVLYYGTDTGDVWQIALNSAEVLDGPEVGTPMQYISLPGTGPVTGIRVDEFRNMWVGKGDTLYLVRRPFDANPAVIRQISAPAGLGGFTGLHASDGDRLDWIDPSTGNIVRMQVYLE